MAQILNVGLIIIIFPIIVVCLVFLSKKMSKRNRNLFKVFIITGVVIIACVLSTALITINYYYRPVLEEAIISTIELVAIIIIAFVVIFLAIGIPTMKLDYVNKEVLLKSADTSSELSTASTELSASAEQVTASAESIEKTIIELKEEMDRIQESSSAIKEVLSFIRKISDKTHLLALNASIEAGRMGGGQGGAFTVIADEMRKFSEESKISVIKSENNIVSIYERIMNCNTVLGNVGASVEEQTASMEEITASASTLNSLGEGLKRLLTLQSPSKRKMRFFKKV